MTEQIGRMQAELLAPDASLQHDIVEQTVNLLGAVQSFRDQLLRRRVPTTDSFRTSTPTGSLMSAGQVKTGMLPNGEQIQALAAKDTIE